MLKRVISRLTHLQYAEDVYGLGTGPAECIELISLRLRMRSKTLHLPHSLHGTVSNMEAFQNDE
jgi:hypothetical protein